MEQQKKTNKDAMTQLREIQLSIQNSENPKEIEYATKAIEEAIMWLSKRNTNITRQQNLLP